MTFTMMVIHSYRLNKKLIFLLLNGRFNQSSQRDHKQLETFWVNGESKVIQKISSHDVRLEMGPDLTRAYFWPAVNKSGQPALDLTQRDFFWPEWKKIDIFRENFPNSNPNHKWLTRPESKFFDPDPSLCQTLTAKNITMSFYCLSVSNEVNHDRHFFKFWLGPWPDTTRAYFWPAVNKGPTCPWPGYFLIRRDFLTQKGKIWNFGEKFSRFRGGWPDPEHQIIELFNCPWHQVVNMKFGVWTPATAGNLWH